MSRVKIERKIHFRKRAKGRIQIGEGPDPIPRDFATVHGRIPRISRLMALAIHFDGLIRDGKVRDYAEIARLGHVSRARVTQIMNLLMLAPDIQAEILFLPTVQGGKDSMCLRELQSICILTNWRRQRELWHGCYSKPLDGQPA